MITPEELQKMEDESRKMLPCQVPSGIFLLHEQAKTNILLIELLRLQQDQAELNRLTYVQLSTHRG